MEKQISDILAGPDRIICERLRANISQRQCAVNQAQARVDPWGMLNPCLKCRHPQRARKAARPKAARDASGLAVPTRWYRQAKQDGNLAEDIPGADVNRRWRDREVQGGRGQ